MTGTYTVINETDVLFELGNWKIQRMKSGRYAHIRVDSIIIHRCNDESEFDDWRIQPLILIQKDNLSMPCMYCKERAPEEIQALWLLQNMDLL